MLDHVFVSVTDVQRSIAFYERALAPLGISHILDYDGKDGPPGHPDLKGFGRDGRVFFWLRPGHADSRSAHIGFVAHSQTEVYAFHTAALAAGAKDNGAPVALRDIGMKQQDVDRACEIALQNQYPNPRPLEPGAIRQLLQDAFDGTRPRA